MDEQMQRDWEELASCLDLSDATALGRELIAAWSEPHRCFHTLRHLAEVVALLREWQASPQLQLAAWFHDAVYDPTKVDNEARSANWARQALLARGLSALDVEPVSVAILATASHRAADATYAPLLDADLSILGMPAERYSEYRLAVRQEYSAASNIQFRVGRSAFLNGMLKRGSIYLTDAARDRFEAQARQNIFVELKSLESA